MTDELQRAEALKQSIQHWKENSEAKTPDEASVGRSNCALCELYNPATDRKDLERCVGCPVHAKTGLKFCQGTPFDEAESLFEEWMGEPDSVELGFEFRKAARREYEFLLGLE